MQLLQNVDVFAPDEVEVAVELIDAAIADAPGNTYEAIVAERDDRVVGYACFGPTPMTDHTWDLYWVAVGPEARGLGLGRRLVRGVEEDVAGRGGRILRAETSSKEAYGATLAFYRATDFTEAGRIPDFYRAGDDLVILYRAFGG